MLIIKKISANIKVKEQMDTFGFEYEFSDGLNIITGENSSGKSSILSCIYYNLGLEQLLGMSKNSILDKCITSDFIYRQTSYKVLESFIELVIENEKGEKATLYRDAICIDGSTGAFIKVTTDNLSKRYYLQAKNDHNDKHGFYHWLQEFIGIQLPRDKETGKNILYSQNLFSACLIEQTKGWSELFSQMPPFSMKGIKDIKSKLVEYLLDLECFYQDFEKDKLKNEKEKLISHWYEVEKYFNHYDTTLSYKINGLPSVYKPMPLLKPNKFKLYINDSGEFKDIQTVYGKKIADLNRLRKDNRLREKIGSKGERRSELKLKLLKLSKVKLAAERNFVAEKVKIDSYISQLDKLKVERQNLIGSKKVDDVLNELSSAESCPLCDSELELNITNHELTEHNYHSSLNFITSKISMVEKYIAMFKYVQDDFDRENKYYNDVILSLKEQISYINRDALSDVELSISREKIYKEINLANEVEKLNRLITEFEKSLDKLIKLNHSVVIINSSISDIDIAFERDLIKIKNFEVKFRNYLKRFDYTSNETWKVNIRDKMPYKLLPSVFNNAIKSNQPIRNASSASDFIRAEWSFYLTLLELSVCHPGILIFDEPGQHAMSPKTLKELVTVCSNLTGKQVLLAISKFTKGYDEFKEENTWSINNLIEGRNNIRVIDIDDDEQKLVKLLS